MAIRPIVIHGNPVLHRPAAPVTEFNDELKELVADMYETMDASNGVGLAAPQIGVGLRIFTYKMENEDGVPPRGCIINPVLTLGKISTADPDPYEEEEGCLSFPGYGFPLKRAEWVTVNGLDEHGNPVHFEATGWFARCMQHETDHLDGILYVDRLDGEERREASRRMRAGEVDHAARRIGAERAAAVSSVFGAPAGTGAAR